MSRCQSRRGWAGLPYPPEVPKRAVRMVFDHQGEYPSQWKATESISARLSINHETLRQWVRRAESDAAKARGRNTGWVAVLATLNTVGDGRICAVLRR